MKDLVSLIASSLVDAPDQVEAREVEKDDSTVIELRVAPDDLGKVIGRQGMTAKAVRALLSAVGSRRGQRLRLDILD